MSAAMRALVALAWPAAALDNGLGLTPPMGWRSWNLFGANVDQRLLQATMDGMVARRRTVDGRPTSFCDLGYCDVGLDDNWQACGNGTDGYRYHARSATGHYYPVVNTQRFPDMAAMTRYAHSLGLTVGWYANNCICSEVKFPLDELYQGDVQALADFGFDAIKLDACGSQYDLDLWSDLVNKTGRPVVIENCHWGMTGPTATWCPWHFFRTSGDIRASYGSMVSNLLTTVHWARTGLSRPGCWAYPDMLQLGVVHGVGGTQDRGLTMAEARAHFGAWCIVSSPLTLSFDVNDDEVVDALWPIVANVEAIAINQAWAGHSGSPFKESSETLALPDYLLTVRTAGVPPADAIPSWHYFHKPLGSGRVAVLLMNHGPEARNLTLAFAEVPGLRCASCQVRDVWQSRDLGVHEASLTSLVASHDSAFLVLSPGADRATLRGQPGGR